MNPSKAGTMMKRKKKERKEEEKKKETNAKDPICRAQVRFCGAITSAPPPLPKMFHKLLKLQDENGVGWSAAEDEDGEKVQVCTFKINKIKYVLKGEMGCERHVRTEFPRGTVQWYEGERGRERCVCKYDAELNKTFRMDSVREEEERLREKCFREEERQRFLDANANQTLSTCID